MQISDSKIEIWIYKSKRGAYPVVTSEETIQAWASLYPDLIYFFVRRESIITTDLDGDLIMRPQVPKIISDYQC